MYSTRVVAVLTLVVGLAHCFSWDLVVGREKRLRFYYNGTLTHAEKILTANKITSVTYDPVQYRVLFADVKYPNMSISSFDLSTRKTQSLLTTKTESTCVRVVYDPVTQLLVWKTWFNIYAFSLNPECSNKTVEGNLLVHLNHSCRDVAVDSCGGYIYWITEHEIERVRLDGSEREVIVNSTVYYRLSLAIDQQTQRLYWIDQITINGSYQMSIESANFNGTNKKTLHSYILGTDKKGNKAYSLTVSKDFIYWQKSKEFGTWQLPKNSLDHIARKLNTYTPLSLWIDQRLAANYTIHEQIQGIKSCEALQGLFQIPNNSKPESKDSICQNYCLEGDCSVNAEEKPTCSCNAGYTGNRCEVDACHQYCLHNGVCTLNEEDEPFCECTADYEGERCDVAVIHAGDCADNSTLQQVLRDLRNGILYLFSDKLDDDES